MTQAGRALLVAAVIGLSACGGKTSSSDDTAPSSGTSGWAGVANMVGEGGAPQDSAPFAVHGGKVRIRFTVQPNSSGPVPLKWQMMKQGVPAGPLSLAEDACASCDGPKIHNLGMVPAGSYYLRVITSRPWTLKVEETR